MKTNYILFLLLAASVNLFAQFETNYTPLTCKGQIPASLLQSIQQKYKADQLQQVKTHDHTMHTDIVYYNLQSNYILDQMMRSGVVLFNDDISLYLNDVASTLIPDTEIDLKNKVHVYTLRSMEVNAFATQRGDIFVTIGLLCKLKSAVELAFVLAHEISHVKQAHNLKIHLQFGKQKRKTKRNKITYLKTSPQFSLSLCLSNPKNSKQTV